MLLAVAWIGAVVLNRWGIHRHDGTGDAQSGTILFAESIRWLFIIWGFAGFCRGLRRQGCRHQIRLCRWCSTWGGLFVVPDLMRRRWQLGHAERLAARIDELAPRTPVIHLVGYSSGSFIVLEACKRVRNPQVLGKVVILAGSVSPSYPLEGLASQVTEIHNFHSIMDVITGLGPLIFGSNDRRWAPAAGTVGFQASPAFLKQYAWRPSHIRWGYWGDHFTIASPAFVARQIAPILMEPVSTTPGVENPQHPVAQEPAR